jgi:tetratricopeptide (TPR) repeat protein
MMRHTRGRGLVVALLFATCLFCRAQDSAAGPSTGTEALSPPQAVSGKPSGQAAIVPQSTLSQALALFRKGDFGGAILKYQQLLQEKPSSPDAYAGLTRAFLKQKDVTQAYETVTRGLQVSDSWPIRVALGEVYFRQGKIPEAEKEWVAVINSGHLASRAYLGLARVRWAIEMNKAAKAMIDKAFELDPSDPDIKSDWIETLPRSEAIKFYEAFLADTKNSDAEQRAKVENSLTVFKDRPNQQW